METITLDEVIHRLMNIEAGYEGKLIPFFIFQQKEYNIHNVKKHFHVDFIFNEPELAFYITKDNRVTFSNAF